MPNTLALAQVTQRLNRARLGNILATRDTNLPEPSDRPPIANPVFSFYDGYNPHLMSDTNLWDLHIVARNQNVVIRGFESTLPREQSRESQVEVEQPSEGDMEDRFESGHSQPREEENDENDENNPSSIYEDALSHFSSYSSFFSLRYTSCSHSLSTLGRGKLLENVSFRLIADDNAAAELGMNSFDRDEVSGEEQSDSFIPSMAESASISSYPSSYGPLSPFSQLDIGTPLAHSTPHLLSSFAHDSKSDAADIDHSLEIELWSQDIFYVDGTPDIDMIPGDELSDSVAGSPSPSSHSSFSPIRQRDVDSPPLVHSPPFSLVDYIRTSRTEREAINHLLDHEIWVRDVLGFDEESDEEDLVEGSTSPSPTGRHDNDPPSLAHQTPFSLVDYIRTSESEMDDVNQLLEHEIWIRDDLRRLRPPPRILHSPKPPSTPLPSLIRLPTHSIATCTP
ncbi:hypothetical protein NLI96_g10227 [Meripilus lineatus]|uniref:Uncharacterized protein n=1 Tax=Meripilus lineatus TaxID=2056292 RepID=A0AAD5UU11_9APHY|nr:hypothetical protein NLI96_g10227 [Physisporinus lineatus]